ncbi:transcription factor bHLH89-like [Prosopis cineraria]|uniref:transcription factor bHLH89-like n=1 Tax=Prosopis cineraria TaxID=364024 RepID=UPI00240F05CB|nr:transcription factor bHLH89-like [Prosopis cineraria]
MEKLIIRNHIHARQSTQEKRDQIMYEDTSTGFSAGTASSLLSEDCFSQMASSSVASHTLSPSFPENVGLSMENLAFTNSQRAIMIPNIDASSSAFTEPNPLEDDSNQLVISFDQSKWHDAAMNMNFHHQNYHQPRDRPLPYPTASDLRHRDVLYSFPSSAYTSSFVNSTSLISFGNPATQNTVELQTNPSGRSTFGAEITNVSSVLFQDSFLHRNLPAGPPANREWFQSLPAAARNDFLIFNGDNDDDKERSGVVSYLDADRGREFGDSNNDFLKISQDLAPHGRSKGGGGIRGGKRVRQVTIEKKRRVDFTSKFDALRELIPKPTKNDRASLLCGAIEYIQELRRSVENLTLLVNKKRCGKERIKRHKVEEEGEEDQEEAALGDLESCNLKPLSERDHEPVLPHNRCMIRSNLLQKKSADTEVDVRIIEDEVTIKLVQRKNTNCLLYASRALDELELDLQHVAGGHIGDFCSFLFNSKIYEGSSVCASAIANKLIQVMEVP